MLNDAYPGPPEPSRRRAAALQVVVESSGRRRANFVPRVPGQNHADGLGCGFHPNLKTAFHGRSIDRCHQGHLSWWKRCPLKRYRFRDRVYEEDPKRRQDAGSPTPHHHDRRGGHRLTTPHRRRPPPRRAGAESQQRGAGRRSSRAPYRARACRRAAAIEAGRSAEDRAQGPLAKSPQSIATRSTSGG